MLFKQEPDTRKHGSFSSHTTSAATTPRRRPQLSPPPQDQARAPRPSGKPQLGGSKGDVDPAGRRGQGPDPWGARCGEVGSSKSHRPDRTPGGGPDPSSLLCCASRVGSPWLPCRDYCRRERCPRHIHHIQDPHGKDRRSPRNRVAAGGASLHAREAARGTNLYLK